MDREDSLNFLELPPEIIDMVLSHLTYEELANARAVNQAFNKICSNKLNRGFEAVQSFHAKCLKDVKSQVPRRESERKKHPLCRNLDILMALESRLSLLSMIFSKYIDTQLCCFIPGKIIDYLYTVLYILIAASKKDPVTNEYPILPRPHIFLEEFRDISSMATEYFEEKIVPVLNKLRPNRQPRHPRDMSKPKRILANGIKDQEDFSRISIEEYNRFICLRKEHEAMRGSITRMKKKINHLSKALVKQNKFMRKIRHRAVLGSPKSLKRNVGSMNKDLRHLKSTQSSPGVQIGSEASATSSGMAAAAAITMDQT